MINLDNFWKTRAMANRGQTGGGSNTYGGWYGQPGPTGGIPGTSGGGIPPGWELSPFGGIQPKPGYYGTEDVASPGNSGTLFGPGTSGYGGGYDPTQDITLGEEFEFNMPPEWLLAQDIYGQFAQGIPYGMPSAWSGMMGPMMDMVRGGRPVDVSAIGEALKPGMERQLDEFTAQALERADLGGLAQSSPLGAELTRESERMSENWGTLMAQMEAGAQENAMQRALAALNPALAMGQGQFGMEQAGRQEQLAALPGLIGTGWLPMELAERQMGVGSGMYNAQASQIQQMMNNPYMMQLLQMLGNTGFVDPRYQQGPLSTGMDIFGQLAPYLGQIFGSGSPPTQPIGDVAPGPGPGFPY